MVKSQRQVDIIAAKNYQTINHFKEFQYNHAPQNLINYDKGETTTELDESESNL